MQPDTTEPVPTPPLPPILTIAGSDSGGGAGIQADLKTIAMLGGYGCSVVTALTAQNTLGVTGVHAPPPEFVSLQLDAVLSDIPVAAAKTGMLFSAGIIEAVADRLKDKSFPLVVDPVCVSQSGHSLLRADAVEAMKARILPLADILTPNKPEAELLAGMTIDSEDAMREALARLQGLGARRVLIKGGHFLDAGDAVSTDWLLDETGQVLVFTHERVHTPHTHGTGCTLSAAIATGLGLGLSVPLAVQGGRNYLLTCLRTAFAVGHGAGPVNHSAPAIAASERAATCG